MEAYHNIVGNCLHEQIHQVQCTYQFEGADFEYQCFMKIPGAIKLMYVPNITPTMMYWSSPQSVEDFSKKKRASSFLVIFKGLV